MIGLAPAHAGTPLLLAQNGAQPPPDEAVQSPEQAWSGVLEVTKPPPQHRVDVSNDPLEAVAAATNRPDPHLVLEGLQTFGADEAHASFKPITQEVEALARLLAVTDFRLVRV